MLLSCISKFNTNPFNTWRSAFRETVKLSKNGDEESQQRLKTWLQPLDVAEYKEEGLMGAKMGIEYAQQNADNIAALDKINDYEFLKEMFHNVYN